MRYVLSYTLPPVAPAAFGQSSVSQPFDTLQHTARAATEVLAARKVNRLEAKRLGSALACRELASEWVHTGTGLIFRIDDADIPPNVCPCCGRLVTPEGNAFAGHEDTLCDGCYPWHRTTPGCLPANSAHTEET